MSRRAEHASPARTPPRGCRDPATWRALAKKIAEVDAQIAEEQERIKNAEPTLAQSQMAYDKCKATKPITVCNQTILPFVNSVSQTIAHAKAAITELKKRRTDLVADQQKACA